MTKLAEHKTPPRPANKESRKRKRGEQKSLCFGVGVAAGSFPSVRGGVVSPPTTTRFPSDAHIGRAEAHGGELSARGPGRATEGDVEGRVGHRAAPAVW